jgi:DNA-binding response OmpR family regulator
VPRVLVVEDDAPILSMIVDELTHLGFEVDTATNGAEALEQVVVQRPDAIVLDLMLPVLHGWAFVEQYLEHTGGHFIPIVVVSAAGAVTRSMEALGVRYFLPKPIDLEQLATCLNEVVA